MVHGFFIGRSNAARTTVMVQYSQNNRTTNPTHESFLEDASIPESLWVSFTKAFSTK
jgi:hypothetical protein